MRWVPNLCLCLRRASHNKLLNLLFSRDRSFPEHIEGGHKIVRVLGVVGPQQRDRLVRRDAPDSDVDRTRACLSSAAADTLTDDGKINSSPSARGEVISSFRSVLSARTRPPERLRGRTDHKEHSHGQLKATAGNVYPRLHELKEAGDARAGKTEGRREKIDYGITEQGKRTLREEP